MTGSLAALHGMRLDRGDAMPIYRQIEARIRAAILDDRLAPGTRLPSSRSLASQLAVARATVELAYNVLAGDGLIEGHAAAGTIVAPRLQADHLRAARRREVAQRPVIQPSLIWSATTRPLQMGVPAFDAFPRKLWTRLAARTARGLSTAQMTYQDTSGYEPLRRELVRYLAIARGVVCSVDQVFITAGFQGALGLIARILLKPDDEVWVEDPGYFFGRDALALAGGRPVPVPVDGDGLDIAAGMARAPEARFVVVTPTNQFPLGASLTTARRADLLAWAGANGTWIIEDDYDSEFRYRGPKMPALKSIDAPGRVLYVGTFSKVLFPALRLGYLVVPEPLIERFATSAALLQPQPSLADQITATAFMAEGHFARHVARMRGLYAERREALLQALAALTKPHWAVEAAAGGMHVIAHLPAEADDAAAVMRAHAAGLAPEPLSRFAMEAETGPGLLLSFTNLPAEAAARTMRKLHRALQA
ncbi:PLP-dependent aminotransferase family protein [Vineibacter terrae]|uniref:MocR-like pyridoxine biosynthesis transcription factor PdxR n=1 Tax=Vineibacter terrae TaxID=2586908 RepID=UPI002E32A289|nr:PLP-dependent aminotransferase family protein [Vineibacter terrae]HEX2890791.1 PLP-dependent aminotransferase family protein [Vineibacter terrae]